MQHQNAASRPRCTNLRFGFAGRLGLAGLLVAVCSSFWALGPGASTASACTEYGNFLDMTSAPNNTRIVGTGSYNRISLTYTPSFSCDRGLGRGANGQTARVLLNGVAGNWVESGYMAMRCENNGSYPCRRAFFEVGLNSTLVVQDKLAPGCLSVSSNIWRGFRIELHPATGDFGTQTVHAQGYIDCEDGAGWRSISTGLDVGTAYPSGFAQGESFRWDVDTPSAATTSSANETHSSLQWLDSNNAWQTPDGVLFCETQTDRFAYPRRDSATQFAVVGSSQHATPYCP